MTRDEFFLDAKSRGKTKEQALAGAEKYYSLYGDFDEPRKQEFKPDELLNENLTDGMPEKEKVEFQKSIEPSDNAKFRARRYFETKDQASYQDDYALDQRARLEMGTDDDSDVDYVGVVKYLTDVTAPYARAKKENATAGDIGKGTASSFMDTVASFAKVALTTMAERPSMSLFDKPEKSDISEATSTISDSIKGITPESWKESRLIMQNESGRKLEGNILEKAMQGAKQSFMLVADNAPNLVASRANPMLGYSIMYSSEKESMYNTLIDAGADKAIAEDFSTMYGSVSAPIEYAENAGRMVSVFGKKKVAGKASAYIRRQIKGKLKEAGVNIIEELSQEGAFNAIYNAAVKSNNDQHGTEIEHKSMTWGDAYKTAKASLQMSVMLEAIGVPVKIGQNRANLKKNTKQMIDAGFTAINAEKYANDIKNVESQEELDAIILEITSETEAIESKRAEGKAARVEAFSKPKTELMFPEIPKTQLITGPDGTPLTDGDYDAIRENYTDEKLSDMIEGDAGDVFVKAVNGDANARAEYNRLAIEDQYSREDEGDTAQEVIKEEKAPESNLVNVAKEIVLQEVLPLIEESEQDYVKEKLLYIIDNDTAEDAVIELKRLHEGYPNLPRSVDKYIMDAVNLEKDTESKQPVAEPEATAAPEQVPITESKQTVEQEQAIETFIPKEDQATPKQEKESAEFRADDDTVFVNKEEIRRVRESKQFESLSPAQKIEWQVHLDNAKRMGLDLDALNIAERVIATPRVITPTEHAAFVLRTAQLFNQSDDVLVELEKAIVEGRDSTELQSQLAQINNQIDTITRAGDLSGTEAGRALNIRKMGIERDTYELAEVVRRATAMKGKPLSSKQLMAISGVVKQIEELTSVEDKLIADIEASDTVTVKQLANDVVNDEIDAIKGKRDLVKLKAEEKKLKAKLRKMGYRMNDITGVTVEGSALIAKLAVNYIKQGANNLDEVVSKVQSVMPEASEKNVYDALSGRHKSVKQRVRTESAKRLSELKTQANISSKIIDATNGIFTKSGINRPSSLEVRRLLSELRKLQATAENTQRTEAKLQKILDTIGKVEIDIQQSNYPKKKGLVIDEDARIKEANANLTELRKLLKTDAEIADLSRRIKERDYEGLFSPRTVKAVKSKELEAAILKKHQLKRELRIMMDDMRAKTAKDYAVATADFFRAARATADMSYFLRQGIIPLMGHPIIGTKAMADATRSFFSQNTADSIDLALKADDMQLQRDKYGLFLSEMDGAIEGREEMFRSSLIHKIPVLGKVAKMSDRHMTVGLNMLRAGLFDDFIKKHPEASDETKRAYARYVNIMTGRGDLKAIDNIAGQMLLFSPKFTASRIQAIPVAATSAIKHKELRGEIARQWGAFIGTGLAILGLAKMAGFEVGDDPEEPDFGKIVINGRVRVDVWGGLQQPTRLFLRMGNVAIGKSDENIPDIAWQFFKYKFAPGVTVLSETVSGRDWVTNQEINRGLNLGKSALPLIFESAWDAYDQELPAEEVAVSLGGEFFGLGVQTYEKKKKKSKSSVWN